jgi:hypothetical protein
MLFFVRVLQVEVIWIKHMVILSFFHPIQRLASIRSPTRLKLVVEYIIRVVFIGYILVLDLMYEGLVMVYEYRILSLM